MFKRKVKAENKPNSTEDQLYTEILQDIKNNPANWQKSEKGLSQFTNHKETIVIEVNREYSSEAWAEIVYPEKVSTDNKNLQDEIARLLKNLTKQYDTNIPQFILEYWRGKPFILFKAPRILTCDMKKDLSKSEGRWAVGEKHVWFEKESDACFWRLNHNSKPSKSEELPYYPF